MSVLSVPLESVGEGSICWGYGDGGGARVSDVVKDLVRVVRTLCDTVREIGHTCRESQTDIKQASSENQ